MSKPTLPPPTLRRDETILGWSYYAFQMIVLPSLLLSVNGLLKKPASETTVNFIYFTLNFIAALWIYHRFLTASLRQVKKEPAVFLQGIVLALAAYWVSFLLVTRAIYLIDPKFINRNDASISGMTRQNYWLMLIGTCLMAPAAEECVFRGLMFRNLWKTSHVAAYLVSMCAFSAVHIVGFLGKYSPLETVLAYLQYLPAGLCLAWCYVKSGTILGPMAMHTIINIYNLNRLR